MRVATCLLLVLIVANKVVADDLRVTVQTDRTTYNVGDTVQWQSFLTLSNVQNANFGVLTVGMDLADSQGVQLSVATIGPAFSDYSFTDTGNNTSTIGQLQNVGAFQFSYNSGVVEVTQANPGPTLLASGTFLASVLGPQTLTAALDAGQFFPVPSGISGTDYANLIPGSTDYNVAVPEPSTMMLSLLGAVTAVGYSLRRRAKARRKAQA